MTFKIAISASHCLTTAGKRLPKKLDPKQTAVVSLKKDRESLILLT